MKRLRWVAGHIPTEMRPEGGGYSNKDMAWLPVPARTWLGAAPRTMVWLVVAPGATATVRLGATIRPGAVPARIWPGDALRTMIRPED